MPLTTTPGSATADSYATLAEADAYNASRLHSETWDDASDATKEAALRMATRLLDAYPRAWTGSPVDGTQALGWPRNGMLTRNGFAIPTSGASSIPQPLKDAESEFARQLIDADRTEDNTVITQGIVGLTAGPVSLQFQDLVEHDGSPLVARTVRELNALMAVLPDAVKYLLVSSWLLKDPEQALTSQVFVQVD